MIEVEKTVRFSVSMSQDLLKKFDKMIKEKMYENRSKAIRDLIRDFIVEQEWERAEKEVMGSLTILYDHEKRGLVDRLIDLQHERYANILSSMHVHIDERNCIEVLVIKGPPDEVKKISDKLLSCKGVKHGKLVMTSTGKEII